MRNWKGKRGWGSWEHFATLGGPQRRVKETEENMIKSPLEFKRRGGRGSVSEITTFHFPRGGGTANKKPGKAGRTKRDVPGEQKPVIHHRGGAIRLGPSSGGGARNLGCWGGFFFVGGGWGEGKYLPGARRGGKGGGKTPKKAGFIV